MKPIHFRSVLFLTISALVPANAHGGNPKGGWQPEISRVDELLEACGDSNGSIDVTVDTTACTTAPTQCAEFAPFPAAETNRNPVRWILQVVTPEPIDDLTLESFVVRTQFSPPGESSIEPLTCPECFENREGGTYSMWFVPTEGNWDGGSYYVLLNITTDATVLPALVRFDIPFGEGREPPRAVVTISPPEGQVGLLITFDGSASTDPEGEITCYQWQILSDNPDDPSAPNPEIVQGPTTSGLQRVYVNEQVLAVTLLVSDRNDLVCSADDPEPAEAFSPLASRMHYEIRCANSVPTAVIAGPSEIFATGSPGTLTSVTLDGTLSFDNETRIERFIWSCGNAFAPVNVAPDGSIVVCRYRLGTFTASLVVTDQGTGVIDPNTGTFECQKASEEATVTVNVIEP